MLKNTLSFVLLCAVALALAPQAMAQEGQQEVDVTLKIYRWGFSNGMRIPDLGGSSKPVRAVKKPKEVDESLWYKEGDEYKELDVKSRQMSAPIRYKGPQKMRIYRRDTIKDEKGVSHSYKEVCSIMLPLGVDETFALMFGTGTAVNFYPMNISPKQLPKDKIAVLNMTSHNIAMALSGDAKFLRAGSNLIFAPKRKKDSSALELQIARFVDKKWKVIYKNNLTAPNGERCLVLIYDPYKNKTPKFNIQILKL